jgi:hypothetical protein
MKRLPSASLIAVVLLAGTAVALADPARIGRNALEKLEFHLDMFLVKGPDPCEMMGNTRGVYLDGYGAVFTSLVALVPTPTPSPFRAFTQKDFNDIHERKIRQIPIMKEKIRSMLLMMAADPSLEAVRPHEQIVSGVTFFYYKQWENMSGLPLQIVMEGEKQKLLDVQSGRVPRSQLDSIIKVQEL